MNWAAETAAKGTTLLWSGSSSTLYYFVILDVDAYILQSLVHKSICILLTALLYWNMALYSRNYYSLIWNYLRPYYDTKTQIVLKPGLHTGQLQGYACA